jgi:hypothetical protein
MTSKDDIKGLVSLSSFVHGNNTASEKVCILIPDVKVAEARSSYQMAKSLISWTSEVEERTMEQNFRA